MRVSLKSVALAATLALGTAGLATTDAYAALSGQQLQACQQAGDRDDMNALRALVDQDRGQADLLVECVVQRKRTLAVQAAVTGASAAPEMAIRIGQAATRANPGAAADIFAAIAGLRNFRGNIADLANAIGTVSGVRPEQVAQINIQRDLLLAPAAGGTAGTPPAIGGEGGGTPGDNPNITESAAAVASS